MSEALNSDAVNLDAVSTIGQSEPAIAIPELAAVAQPADEVIHVDMMTLSSESQVGPQIEPLAEALAASETAVVADAQPAPIVAQELTAAATPETIVEEAARLPAGAALDAQSAVAPVLEAVAVTEVSDLETRATAASATIVTEDASVESVDTLAAPLADAGAVTASEAAVSAAQLDSSDQLMAQSEAVPVAEVVAVAVEPAGSGQEIVAERVIAEVIPVASDVAAATPQMASADTTGAVPDAAAAPGASRTSSSTGRLVLIAMVVLVLLAAGVIAFLMFSGTNPLAHFGH